MVRVNRVAMSCAICGSEFLPIPSSPKMPSVQNRFGNVRCKPVGTYSSWTVIIR